MRDDSVPNAWCRLSAGRPRCCTSRRSSITATSRCDARRLLDGRGRGGPLRRSSRGRRVARVALVCAVTPFMLRTDDNPDGVPIEVFDPSPSSGDRSVPCRATNIIATASASRRRVANPSTSNDSRSSQRASSIVTKVGCPLATDAKTECGQDPASPRTGCSHKRRGSDSERRPTMDPRHVDRQVRTCLSSGA